MKENTNINIIKELEKIKIDFKNLSDENRKLQQQLRKNQEESLRLQGIYNYLVSLGKDLGILKDVEETTETKTD